MLSYLRERKRRFPRIRAYNGDRVLHQQPPRWLLWTLSGTLNLGQLALLYLLTVGGKQFVREPDGFPHQQATVKLCAFVSFAEVLNEKCLSCCPTIDFSCFYRNMKENNQNFKYHSKFLKLPCNRAPVEHSLALTHLCAGAQTCIASLFCWRFWQTADFPCCNV